MRTSLIVFGIIFLALGGLLYLVPMQQVTADTSTTGNGNTDSRTSTARVTVPVAWAYTSAIIGFVLLVLGIAVPDTIIVSDSKKDSYEKTVESKEDIEVGDGKKRRIVRERTETRKSVRDEDDD